MRPIALAGFEAKFAGDPDPWRTWTNRDEATKRRAILRALGPGPLGRVLEVAAGNGSNSAALARRARRLDATEATASGAALVASALAPFPRARAARLVLPGRPPRPRYDAVVVAELLYYLSLPALRRTAPGLAGVLRPGGTLVLAHHRVDYPDFAQHAVGLHARFLAATGRGWRVRVVRRTGRWVVVACRPATSSRRPCTRRDGGSRP